MIFLISNIKMNENKARSFANTLTNSDQIFFFNKADNYEYFKDTPTHKVLVSAVKDKSNNYKLIDFFRKSPNLTINQRKDLYFNREDWYGKEKDYFDEHFLRTDFETNIKYFYPRDKKPTTGFLMYLYFKANNEVITLVDFFPNTDNTTTHWDGHDWKYEQEYLDWECQQGYTKIIDLR